jgi:hypothetical protein
MKAFLIIFWIHQVIFGLSSLGAVLNLLLEGGTTGQLNLVPLLLAWIAGSLTWGFGFVMAEPFAARLSSVKKGSRPTLPRLRAVKQIYLPCWPERNWIKKPPGHLSFPMVHAARFQRHDVEDVKKH